jgi:hypothetical protein
MEKRSELDRMIGSLFHQYTERQLIIAHNILCTIRRVEVMVNNEEGRTDRDMLSTVYYLIDAALAKKYDDNRP